MLREQNLSLVAEPFFNLLAYPEFFAQPQRHRHQKRFYATRRIINVGLQQPLEFQKRFIVKSYQVNVCSANPAFSQTVINGVARETMVVLLAREALFLRSSNYTAIAHQARGGIVIVGRYS